MDTQTFSPKEFLRRRHPEKFSDSHIEQRVGLDRSQLEYHLDTLTSRSQETAFELFAKAIAEREVCPNLISHTGPTGGGDSKVDTETFPVSEITASSWFSGIGREAAHERWAFAFSAKKDWKAKINADVQSVVGTERGYAKCFFITNQFVRDKLRASTEDALKARHGIDVRILDRTWLLDATFKNDHVQVAIETLRISTPSAVVTVRGPLDAARDRELVELEGNIAERLASGRDDIFLVEQCIEAAVLSRELERPRTETDGRFDRAVRLAQKHKSAPHRMDASYQWAWTTFWWFEDFTRFSSLMKSVVGLATGTENIHDLQLLCNLWQLLHSSVIGGELSKADAAYQPRTNLLLRELNRLSAHTDRPSASLQAKTLRLEIELALRIASKSPVEDLLERLRQVVAESTGLLGYPLEPLVPICTELGKLLGGNAAYESLFEAVLKIASRRKQDVSAGQLLRKRGIQALERNRPQDAIRMLGRSFGLLYKDESRDECVRAMYACAFAYERLGLLWAARGVLLAAASIASEDFWKYGELTSLQAGCLLHLKWLELALGRIAQALCWHEVDIPVRAALATKGNTTEAFPDASDAQFDVALGLLLMSVDPWALKYVTRLPDHLEDLGLPAAAVMLIHALGQTCQVPTKRIELLFGTNNLHETLLEYRNGMNGTPSPTAELSETRTVILQSHVLGCSIGVIARNERPCIEVAESLLAALESLLATAPVTQLVSREPTLTVDVRLSDSTMKLIEWAFGEDDGRPSVLVKSAPFDPNTLSAEQQSQIKSELLAIVMKVLGRVYIGNPEIAFSNLETEDAIGRAINFTGTFVCLGNVLGKNPKDRISAWIDGSKLEYSLARWRKWDADSPVPQLTAGQQSHRKLKPGSEAPPPEMMDQANANHRAIRTVSVIREALWDEASWRGTGFFTSPEDKFVPILAPIFKKRGPAERIFKLWREEFGESDVDERLRISIVRGISINEPHAYRILVAPGIGSDTLPRDGFGIFVGRTNAMLPRDPENLNRFVKSYHALSAFVLAAATSQDDMRSIAPIQGALIKKKTLYIREAWEIGPNDLDSFAIHEDDEPIIPEGNSSPPVLALLKRKRDACAQARKFSTDR